MSCCACNARVILSASTSSTSRVVVKLILLLELQIDKDLLPVNQKLAEYKEKWDRYVDAWLVIKVSDPAFVFRWRQQAETTMRKAGKGAMTDEQAISCNSLFSCITDPLQQNILWDLIDSCLRVSEKSLHPGGVVSGQLVTHLISLICNTLFAIFHQGPNWLFLPAG